MKGRRTLEVETGEKGGEEKGYNVGWLAGRLNLWLEGKVENEDFFVSQKMSY